MSYTRTVDGFTVDEDRCRISGQAHVEPEDATAFHVGSDVVVVMLARVVGPTFKESKGEMTRVNVLKPLEMHTLPEGDFREIVMTKLKFDYAAVEDPLEDEKESRDVEPEIEFVEPETAVSDDVIEFVESLPQERPSGDIVAGEDDDSVLDSFIAAAGTSNKTPVGGGQFATGEEADRVRSFIHE